MHLKIARKSDTPYSVKISQGIRCDSPSPAATTDHLNQDQADDAVPVPNVSLMSPGVFFEAKQLLRVADKHKFVTALSYV